MTSARRPPAGRPAAGREAPRWSPPLLHPPSAAADGEEKRRENEDEPHIK
ncbi:MAG: hypothetical protein MPW15_28225 [Candidatus Manganitrophus sp.]|nr:hypothetical protein [Candidatus Manganitrophus sp.]